MATVGRLDSLFTNMIVDLMALERKPLERLETQRDTVNVTSGVYSDLDNKLNTLQDRVQALISTDAFFGLTPGRTTAVSNTPTDTTVVTASASKSAVAGQYEIEVSSLARAERLASAVQSSTDLALGKTGNIWLGGTGSAAASVTPNDTLTGVATGSVVSEQRELGTGNYTVETRDNNGTLQFRLKDADDDLVAIADKSSSEDRLTTGWQTLEAGDYDTGRGLVLSFSGAASDVSSSLSYTAAGIAVAIDASDTLVAIANKVNDAVQPEGRDLSATVIGKQLVLSAVNTGTAHTMIYTDDLSGGGLGGFSSLQSAADAEFEVNNIAFTRQSNAGLTDVVSGVTLNLAADAVAADGTGRSALLTINEDVSAARSAINDFVTQFNEVITYLTQKTSVTKTSDGSYKRGILADDTIFNDLRSDLLSNLMSNVSSGSFKTLREIGLTLDDNLKITISDSDKLEDALKTKMSDVSTLMDQVMGNIDTKLSRFTGDSSSLGYLDSTISNLSRQTTEINSEIDDLGVRLDTREQYLTNQFAEMQAQLYTLTYMQQSWSSIYGSTNRMV